MIIENPTINTILDAVAAPILICLNNNILFANHAAENLTDYPLAKLLSMSVSDLVNPSSSTIFQNWYSQQPLQENSESIDVQLATSKKSLQWVRISATATTYGGHMAVMLTLNDTTSFRKIENSLLMSEARGDVLLENNPDVMIITSSTGHFIYVSQSVQQTFGYAPDEIIGNHWHEWVHKEDTHILLAAMDEVRQKAKSVKSELRIRRLTGEYVWCEILLGTVYRQQEEEITLVSVIRNIHTYKLTEFALREREQSLRLVTDNMLDIVLEIASDGLIRYISPSCIAIMGYQPQELIGRSQLELVHPDDVAIVFEYFGKISQRNAPTPPLEFRLLHKDGHYLWLEIICKAIADDTGEMQSIVISCRDVTISRKNRESLRENQQMLEQITDIAPFGIYIYDVHQHRDVYHNQRLIEEAPQESTPENPAGDFYDNFIHPDDVERHRAHQKRLMEAKDGEVIESENRVRRLDGSFTWFYFRDTVFKRDENGSPSQFLGSMQDITERKRADNTLRQNQHLLQKITDTIPLDIYIYDTNEQRNIFFNRTENMGYPLDVIDTQNSGDFYATLVHPDDLYKHLENAKRLRAAKDGELMESEYRMKHASGEWRWYYFRDIVFARNTDGTPSQFLGSIQDITDRKNTEAALRNSQQVLHQVTSTVPLDIYIFDADLNRGVFSNRSSTLGLDTHLTAEADDTFFKNLVHPDDVPLYEDFNRRLEAGADGAYIKGEFRMRHKNGSWIWRSYRSIVLNRHDDGTPSQYLGVVEDVTLRKETEAALRESQHLLQQITDTIPMYIFIYDYDLQYNIFENHMSNLGHPEKILTKASESFFRTLVHPDDLPAYKANMSKLNTIPDSEVLEIEYRVRDVHGDYHWRHYRFTPFARRENGSLLQYLGMMLDIGERKQAEVALREGEEKLRLITDNIHDLVALTDADLKFRYLSPSHSAVLGYKPDELINKHIFELVHPDDLDMIKNKTLFAVERQQADTVEFRYLHHDGYYVWMETTGAIIQTADGEFGGAVFASRDVSERRWMQRAMVEQEKLLVMLQKEQELSFLKSRMMSRLSHELRTPLAIISTSADLLEMYAHRMTETQRTERLQQIKTQIKHFTSMLDNMALVVKGISYSLDFSPAPYNLKNTCETLIAELKEMLHSKHNVQLELKGDMNIVNSDEQLVHLALTHLLANAIKYSPHSKPISIFAEAASKHIIIKVSDEGIGILPDERERVFEPFFRGANIGEVPGLGVGLSIIKDAIDASDGSLSVESELGVGTTVTVEIPLGGMISTN